MSKELFETIYNDIIEKNYGNLKTMVTLLLKDGLGDSEIPLQSLVLENDYLMIKHEGKTIYIPYANIGVIAF